MTNRDGPAPAAAAPRHSDRPPPSSDDARGASLSSITLLCALPREARAITGVSTAVGACAELRANATLYVTGPGPEAAAAAGKALFPRLPTGSLIVSMGVAGALVQALRAGDIVVGTRLIDGDRVQDPDLPLDGALTGRLKAHLANAGLRPHEITLASTESVVADLAQKRALAARLPGASAVDMESVAYAREAARHGLPFVALRVIIDEAHMRIPPAAIVSLGSDGETRLLHLLGSLLRQPGQLPDLLRLGRAWQRARSSLTTCAEALMQPDHL